MDGVTSTASELNILDGVTSTAAELNILVQLLVNNWKLANGNSGALDGNENLPNFILDGVTATGRTKYQLMVQLLRMITAAELNLLDDGVTSTVQSSNKCY